MISPVTRSVPAIAVAVLRRPVLWTTALRQLRRLAAPGWWRRPPFLPVPPAEYVEFRLITQYGDAAHRAEPADVVNYLKWCREWDRAAPTGRAV